MLMQPPEHRRLTHVRLTRPSRCRPRLPEDRVDLRPFFAAFVLYAVIVIAVLGLLR